MAQLTIQVNGRPYTVGCEDGQEAHLLEIARLFDRQVRQVSTDVGQLGETRLFLMGALLLADELSDLKLRLAHAQSELARLQTEQTRVEIRAIKALDAASEKIEALVQGLEVLPLWGGVGAADGGGNFRPMAVTWIDDPIAPPTDRCAIASPTGGGLFREARVTAPLSPLSASAYIPRWRVSCGPRRRFLFPGTLISLSGSVPSRGRGCGNTEPTCNKQVRAD
jgi:cell division protein ZapA